MMVLPDPERARTAAWGADTSPETQGLLDTESRRLIEHAEADVARLLSEHREQLDALVTALLAHETLDEPDAYAEAGLADRSCRLDALTRVAPA